jgi:hypothetical protein
MRDGPAVDTVRRGSHSPHMPRRGAPHAHGPGSEDNRPSLTPETAKAERSWATRGLEQLLQVTFSVRDGMNFSNLAPQSRHSYSKMGIINSLQNIPDGLPIFNRGLVHHRPEDRPQSHQDTKKTRGGANNKGRGTWIGLLPTVYQCAYAFARSCLGVFVVDLYCPGHPIRK